MSRPETCLLCEVAHDIVLCFQWFPLVLGTPPDKAYVMIYIVYPPLDFKYHFMGEP